MIIENVSEHNMLMVEEYLTKIWSRGATNCKSFDELRMYYYAKYATCADLEKLPPTSNTIRLHILRAYYVVYIQTHCLLNPDNLLDPLNFGFKNDGDLLVPNKIESLLPPPQDLIANCNCKVCKKKTCNCVFYEVPCCSFCKCIIEKTCENKFNESVIKN